MIISEFCDSIYIFDSVKIVGLHLKSWYFWHSLTLFFFIYSKLKDTEAKNRELEEQLENMKKEMEESRSRSDKGKKIKIHVMTVPFIC